MECQQIQLYFDNFSKQDEPMLSQLISEPDLFNFKGPVSRQEFSWIDEYLFPDVLEEINSEEPPIGVSSKLAQLSTVEELQDKKMDDEEQKAEHKKNRSIFHNVQKHLITFLKKIHIRRVDLVNRSSGLRAYQLWRIFKVSKDYTKKGLYMVFGVSQDHNQDNIRRLALSCQDLDKIINKNSFETVEEAQALIREQVLLQVSQMTKAAVRSQCKMAKFDEFYDYLQTFLDELSGPGLSIRMKKEQKMKVVEKFSQSSEESRVLIE